MCAAIQSPEHTGPLNIGDICTLYFYICTLYKFLHSKRVLTFPTSTTAPAAGCQAVQHTTQRLYGKLLQFQKITCLLCMSSHGIDCFVTIVALINRICGHLWTACLTSLSPCFSDCSWIDSRSLRHSGPCVTCCGRTRVKTTVLKRPRSTSATTVSEAAPISTGKRCRVGAVWVGEKKKTESSSLF